MLRPYLRMSTSLNRRDGDDGYIRHHHHANHIVLAESQILVITLSTVRRVDRHTGTDSGKFPTAIYITGNS